MSGSELATAGWRGRAHPRHGNASTVLYMRCSRVEIGRRRVEECSRDGGRTVWGRSLGCRKVGQRVERTKCCLGAYPLRNSQPGCLQDGGDAALVEPTKANRQPLRPADWRVAEEGDLVGASAAPTAPGAAASHVSIPGREPLFRTSTTAGCYEKGHLPGAGDDAGPLRWGALALTVDRRATSLAVRTRCARRVRSGAVCDRLEGLEVAAVRSASR